MTLKLLDTFAGIGGFSYAAEKLVGGFKTVQFIEIDSYCQQILNKNFPNIPIHDDITTYRAEPYSASVISAGFPCTDISVAGRGEGITETTRSGLFFQLITTIRMVRPKYIILENVSAILNNGMDIVLGELYKAGYDAEWCCIPSSFVGACHQRDRIWIIAYPIGFRSRSQSKIQTGGNSTSSCGGSTDSPNTKGSNWHGDETQQGDGKPRTQEISRDRNSSQSSHTWRSTEHRLNPNWREYVSQPTICRGDDGLSTKLDAKQRIQRLKMLGNSIVPAVSAIPLQRVIQLEREQQ